MTKKNSGSTRDEIFSSPIKTLNAEELERVVGGDDTNPRGVKDTSSTDNQGRLS